MEPDRFTDKQPLVIAHASKADRSCLGRFSALSAVLHALVLAVLLIRTGERMKFPPPVRIISVDLREMEPVRQHVAPPAPQRRSPAVPARPSAAASAPKSPVVQTQSIKPQPAVLPTAVSAPAAAVAESAMAASGKVPAAAVSAGPEVVRSAVRPAQETARTSPLNVPPVPPPRAVKTVDSNTVRSSYLQRCRGLIEHYKVYPVLARKGGIEGTVVIRGTLGRDGTLRQCDVASSSRSALLDNAALRAVRSVVRFPPVPPELTGAELNFEVPVAFRLSAE